MNSLVERHLAEARQTLAEHDAQRHIIQNEIYALESVVRRAEASNGGGRGNGAADQRVNGHAPDYPPAEDQESVPPQHHSFAMHNAGQPNGESFRAPYGSKRHRIEAAIEQALRESGTPLHRIQIMDYLKRQGIVGSEQNPLGVVSNALSASKRFKIVGNGIWGLADM